MEADRFRRPTKEERADIQRRLGSYYQELEEALRLAWRMNDLAVGNDPDEPIEERKNVR
jgi:hypothetical protein